MLWYLRATYIEAKVLSHKYLSRAFVFGWPVRNDLRSAAQSSSFAFLANLLDPLEKN